MHKFESLTFRIRNAMRGTTTELEGFRADLAEAADWNVYNRLEWNAERAMYSSLMLRELHRVASYMADLVIAAEGDDECLDEIAMIVEGSMLREGIRMASETSRRSTSPMANIGFDAGREVGRRLIELAGFHSGLSDLDATAVIAARAAREDAAEKRRAATIHTITPVKSEGRYQLLAKNAAGDTLDKRCTDARRIGDAKLEAMRWAGELKEAHGAVSVA